MDHVEIDNARWALETMHARPPGHESFPVSFARLSRENPGSAGLVAVEAASLPSFKPPPRYPGFFPGDGNRTLDAHRGAA